jgi:lipopolysaccharide cholinephosphotransferase
MDGAPEKGWKRKWTLFLNQTRNVLAHAYVFNVNPSKLTKLAHKILHLPFVPYDPVKTYKKVNGTAAKNKWKNSREVGLIAFPFKYGAEYIVSKEVFRDTVWLDYEFLKMPAPAGYDEFLRNSYGDYMEFPPVDQRGAWHDFVFEPDVPYKEYKGPRTNH